MNANRRRFLGTLAAAGAAASAGCVGVLGGGGDSNPDVVLGKPDLPEGMSMDTYRTRQFPVWGERLPDVSLPAPLADRTIALREVSTPSMLTFFYSNCVDICPRLVSALANVQDHSVENGYADAVTFLPITFDPVRDDAETLRAYRETMNVEDAGNWHFLRPESKRRAEAVVKEHFLKYVRTEKDGGGDDFTHVGVHLLVNADGYVERAYQSGRGEAPPVETMIDDLRTVRTA
jgi:protein SCO1/2